MASVGPIGNVVYANQMVTVQAAKQMDYQNSVQMQSMIAEAMQNEKEEVVEDVRPAEETYKIDPENEHAFVNFKDGSTTAHLAVADMKLPIAFALVGEIEEPILPSLDLASIGSLSFRPIEATRYPIWEIKDDVLANPTRGVVINAANEVGIAKFFNQEINILELAERTIKAYRHFEDAIPKSLDEVFEIDREVRRYCLSF